MIAPFLASRARKEATQPLPALSLLGSAAAGVSRF